MADFTPVTKTSTNISSDLQKAARDRKLNISDIDFDLLSYETFYKKNDISEWHPLEGSNIFSGLTESEIYDSEYLIRQEYQIRIRPSTPLQYLDLRVKIVLNKNKGILTAIIDPASTIPLKKGIQEWIKTALDKKKLRLGYLIGTADEQLDKEILRLVATIQKNGPLSEPYALTIARYFPPVEVIDDQILFRYKELCENPDDPSLIQGVKPGDMLLEYIFPKKGCHGRGFDGMPIIIREPTIKYASSIQINENTISKIEEENSIRYYALVSGFVKREKGVFTVGQALLVKSVDAKTTSHIEAGTDKEISLKVRQDNIGEDAVGIGMRIDIQTVDINGTVGENTKIKACDLTIGAQTHKNSLLEVEGVAKIKLHRGDLKTKEAYIDVLEGGIVQADIVKVNKMLGGEIYAQSVQVTTLYSHSKIVALESIEIDSIVGEGHILSIDPDSIPAYHEKKAQLQSAIGHQEKVAKELTKELAMKETAFNEKTPMVKKFQQRIIEAKKNNQEPLEVDLINVRRYKNEMEKLEAFRAKTITKQNDLHQLQEMLTILGEAHMYGSIKHHNLYQGNSRVLFVDPGTRKEYTEFPKGKAGNIQLQKKGDDCLLMLNHP